MTSAKVLAVLSRLFLVIALSLIPTLTLSAAPPDNSSLPEGSSEGAPRLPAPEPEPEEDPADVELRQAALAFEMAREQGVEALIALGETLHGPARDILMPEIADALGLLSPQSQESGSAEFPVTGQAEVDATANVGINGAACAYPNLASAITAASAGDTLRLRTRVFNESVDITKTLTIIGGYGSDCITPGIDTVSTISGTGGSVFDIVNAVVMLRNLNITGGSALGGGVDTQGSSRVTLDNADVYSNTSATNGGGIYIGTGSVVTATNDSDIYNNTATQDGGGVRVWGRFVGNETNSDIYDNAAANGGGISVTGGVVLLKGSDLSGNRAIGPTGKGGGVYLTVGGVITLTGTVWIYEGHTAYDGAGIYADDSEVHLGSAVIQGCTASHFGGGVYLTNGSTLDAAGATIGYPQSDGMNQAVHGGGIYAISSTVQFRGALVNNEALNNGGGLYARASTVDLINSTVGGTNSYESNRIGVSGFDGAGLYLTSNTIATLQNTAIISNSLTNPATGYGAGLSVWSGSVVTITNSRIERNTAPSTSDGRGGAIYIKESTVTLDNTDVLSNTAGSLGGAVRVNDATLTIINGSILRANRALNGEGGAIAAGRNSSATLNNAIFKGNTTSTDGGAVYMDGSTLDAVNCAFSAGQADNHGGAIASRNATVTISSDYNTCYPLVQQCSTLYDNTADSDSSGVGYGGAIYGDATTLTIDHTYLHHNAANRGGAIYQDGTAGKLQIQNSLIYRNTTITAVGSGIRSVGGMVTLQHVTIADNSGGAAYSQSGTSSYIINSIAWGNGSGFLGTLAAASCNIDQAGNAGLSVNPRFISSGIGNYHLAPISPAIDACATGLSPDLDNVTRPGNTGYDMGAYEFIRRLYLPLTLKN